MTQAELASVSDDDLAAEVLKRIDHPQNIQAMGLIFNRTPAVDPTTGQPVAVSHPVIDALKTLLTSFVTTAGPQLTPLLLQLLTGILGKAQAAVGAPAKTA